MQLLSLSTQEKQPNQLGTSKEWPYLLVSAEGTGKVKLIIHWNLSRRIQHLTPLNLSLLLHKYGKGTIINGVPLKILSKHFQLTKKHKLSTGSITRKGHDSILCGIYRYLTGAVKLMYHYFTWNVYSFLQNNPTTSKAGRHYSYFYVDGSFNIDGSFNGLPRE